MVTLRLIQGLINIHLNRVLLAAEAALPAAQYLAYRRVVLAELGRKGLQRKLQRLFASPGETTRAGIDPP